MNLPYSFTQPGLALTQSVISSGVYPGNVQWGGGNVDSTAIGMIFTSAFPMSSSNLGNTLLRTQGDILPFQNLEELYSIIGHNYGGTSETNFGLPSLGGAMMVGSLFNGSQTVLGEIQGSPFPQTIYNYQLPPSLGGAGIPIQNQQYSQAVNHVIQADGFYPLGFAPQPGMVGTVSAFLGGYTPGGFLECNGQLVSVQQFPLLFKVLGTTYGGDGVNWFGVPDLTESVPIGTGGQFKIGQTVGASSVSLQPNLNGGNGAPFVPVPTMQPSVALHFLIDTVGIYDAIWQNTPTIGQIVMYAGKDVPSGWVRCEGQLLPIASNEALFALIGKNFGGDGITNFAVPDLRDRAIVGTGGPTNLTLGQVIGQNFVQLTTDNLPPIMVPVPGLSLKNDTGASGSDHITNISDVQLSGLWPNSKVEYSKDGSTWTATLQAVEGNNTVYVRQLDYIGQTSAKSAAFTFVLDTQAPVAPTVAHKPEAPAASILGGAANGLPTSSTGGLVLGNIEKGAILAYSTDGGVTWSDHFQATPGVNHVQVRQTDLAGNVSKPSAVLEFEYTGTVGQTASTLVTPMPDGGSTIRVTSPGTLPDALGTAGVDTIIHTLNSDLVLPRAVENVVLSGVGAGSTISGNAGNNNFQVESGSWKIDGGAGQDSVSFKGAMKDYQITHTSKNGLATVVLGPDGQVEIKNIEQLNFSDGTLHAQTSQYTSWISGLYQAALNRQADFTGLKAWQHAMQEQGLDKSAVVSSFLQSSEYTNHYGTAQSSQEFVSAMYHNMLGRTPDNKGLAGWVGALETHKMTRADVVTGILGSAEAQSKMESFFSFG